MKNAPYRLTAHRDRLFAGGPDSLLTDLARVPDAQRHTVPGIGACVSLPASRSNFLVLEAMSTPATVSDTYRELRDQTVDTGPSYRGEVRTHLRTTGFQRELLDHQAAFCVFAWNHMRRPDFHTYGFLNASEMGTGKTAMALAMIHLWQPQRVLVVAPKSVCPGWLAEWEQCWKVPRPFAFTLMIAGSRDTRTDRLRALAARPAAWPVIVALNYEVLADLEPAVQAFAPQVVIYDESHRIKNPEAAVTEAAIRIADQSDYTLCMSGTPIGNHMGDLYSQLRVVMGELMPYRNYWQFVARYATIARINVGPREVQKVVGVQDPAGLMQLMEPVWWRATKESCLTLPPKQYQRVELELPTLTRELYDDVEENGTSVLGNPLSLDSERVALIRLHQIAGGHIPEFTAHDPELGAEEGCGREYRLRPSPECPKIAWMEEFARDVLRPNPTTRALIFCRYLAEIDRIQETLSVILGPGRAAPLTGRTGDAQLPQIIAEFNSRSEEGVQVLVCQVQKASLGLNLQAADFSIFFSNSWSWLDRTQAESRSHRHGREGAVQIIDLVCQDTIDEQILRALDRKSDFSERLCKETIAAR